MKKMDNNLTSGLDLSSHHMIFISTEHLEFVTEYVGGLLLPLLVKLLHDLRIRTTTEKTEIFFTDSIFTVHLAVATNTKHM